MRGFLLIACGLLFGAVGAAGAQGVFGEVSGRVVDSEGRPVAGVRVTVPDVAREAATDARGWFALDRLRVGTYVVRFESSRHGAVEYQDVRVSGGAVVRLDVRLERGTKDDPVVARRGPSLADLADPGQRYSISGELLRSLSSDYVEEILSVLPGVSDVGAISGPSIGGTRPGEATYSINGIPVRRALSGVLLLHPTTTALEEVAVIPAAGADFGDTYGGWFSLATRSGSSHLAGAVRYSTDEPFGRGLSLGVNRLDGSVGGPLGPARFFIGGSLQGQLGFPYGAGVAGAPAYVTAGIDTTVLEDYGSGTVPVPIPRFAQFNGDCDPGSNAGVACQGRRLPYEVGTVGDAIGRLDYEYARGLLVATAVLDVRQHRQWPGRLSFDHEAFQGIRTTGTVYGLSWSHDLLRRGGERLTIEASASYQQDSWTSGNLDAEWELEHRSPVGGFLLSPMRFVVDVDRFSADTGAYAVTSLRTAGDWDQLIENHIYDRGTRVPFPGRDELQARGSPRINPWGVVTSYPTRGLWTAPGSTELSRERRWWGHAVLEWHPRPRYRVRVGGEWQSSDTRYFSGSLIRVLSPEVIAERPTRVAGFAAGSFSAGPFDVEAGLRWERFAVGGRLPIIPGRIFTNPAFNQDDPSSLDSVLAPIEPHATLLPNVGIGLRLARTTGARLAYRRLARVPEVAGVMRGSVADLASTPVDHGFGRDLDWVESTVFEFGLRQVIGWATTIDVAVQRRGFRSAPVWRVLPFFDTFSDRYSNVLALQNYDLGAAWGGEVVARTSVLGWLHGSVSYTYQDTEWGAAPAGRVLAGDVRRHTVAGVVDIAAPPGSGDGPWHQAVLRGMRATGRLRVASGRSYTPLRNYGLGELAPAGTEVWWGFSGPLNSERLPWITELDLRVERQFRVSGWSARIFADLRNALGAENVQVVFAETGETENEEHRRVALYEPQLLSLEQDARASGRWIQIAPGGGFGGADVSGDCSTWFGAGGRSACVALRRAEARWGNGDGIYDTEEFTRALDAMYELFYGRWTMLGRSREVRIGVEVRF